MENSRGLSCTALSSRQLIVALAVGRHLQEVGGVELGLAEERLGTLLVELDDLAEQHAGRGRRQPTDSLELGLAVGAGEVLQDRAQVVEVDQREPGLVGVVEHERQRRRLGLVGAEHLGEELRAERRHRGAHGHTGPETAEREERHREAGGSPLDAEVGGARGDPVVGLAGLQQAGEVALHVGREHGHAHARELLGHELQRLGLAGAGGARR